MSQATSQATNQAANLVPKTVPGVLVQIGYSTHLLVPSSVVGTLIKILDQSVLVQENWTRESGELLVNQSGDGFKMKLGCFYIYTPEQHAEFRRLEDEKREAENKAAAAEANNDAD